MRRFRPFAAPRRNCNASRSRDISWAPTASWSCRRNGHPHQTAYGPAAGSGQSVEQHFRFFQVGGVEALGKPAVNRREQLARLAPPALLVQEPDEAHGGTQLVASRALLTGDREGSAERPLGLRLVAMQ